MSATRKVLLCWELNPEEILFYAIPEVPIEFFAKMQEVQGILCGMSTLTSSQEDTLLKLNDLLENEWAEYKVIDMSEPFNDYYLVHAGWLL